ncbi:MAG: hypothetical protein AAFQ87_25480, partial [Bacteroidota bacterium]
MVTVIVGWVLLLRAIAIPKILTADSCESEITQTVSVDSCYSYCQADFYHQQDDHCNVYFQDQSVAQSPIIAWYWDFG